MFFSSVLKIDERKREPNSEKIPFSTENANTFYEKRSRTLTFNWKIKLKFRSELTK